ncbi:MAG: hypothetical protein R2681_15160 [Pyrinomonadaceae bacterium]
MEFWTLLLIVVIFYLGFLVLRKYSRYREHLDHKKSRNSYSEYGRRNSGSFGEFLTFIWEDKNEFFLGSRRKKKPVHEELMRVLMGLDEQSLEELLILYKNEFGSGPARYARKTYKKWEKGKVRPIRQTFERFLVHLPKVMSFDLKCEVLRHLMEEYGTEDTYDLTVYTDDWEKTLEPLVRKLIDKPYNAVLPKQIEDSLNWLADDETKVAEMILKRSHVEEAKIAVSMLREEVSNIERLMETAKGRSKVFHQLKFPYGTINLSIKRR